MLNRLVFKILIFLMCFHQTVKSQDVCYCGEPYKDGYGFKGTCHFPFTYRNKENITNCIDSEYVANLTWCPFADFDGRDTGWGYCKPCKGVTRECSDNPCKGNKTCVAFKNCVPNYKCICPDGYDGTDCEKCIRRPCDASPCHNGGTCTPAPGCADDYICKCLTFFRGKNCNESLFLPTPSKLRPCSCHIRDKSIWNETFHQSLQLCESLDSNLASVKNFNQQEKIKNLVEDVYGNEKNIAFSTGGRYYQGSQQIMWMDNTSLPINGTNGFPRWFTNHPVIRKSYGVIILTKQASNKEENIFWKTFPPNRGSGVICEKLVSGKPCDNSSSCLNGASCMNVGCSYRCQCVEPYKGRHCELFPARLAGYSPSTKVFSNNFTLTCTVEGNPIPKVNWNIKKNRISTKLPENASIPDESLFHIETSTNVIGFKVESKLSIAAGGLCLGRSEVSCWAVNKLSTEAATQSFKLNNPSYKPFKESYFVFSSKEMLSANNAKEACVNLTSNLAHIPDKATQNFLQKNVKDKSWIGLRLNENGIRLWPDQQKITYSNWEEGEPNASLSCTYMSESNKWKTQVCSETTNAFKAYYICQKSGREIPTFINITSPLCGRGNESALHVMWRPSHYMKTLSHTLMLNGSDKVIHYNLNNEKKRYETYSHSFYGLKSRKTYQLKIEVEQPYCSKRLFASASHMTGYVKPGPLTNATLQQPSNNTCIVRWTWPKDREHTIENFIVKVTKLPNITWTGSYELIVKSLTTENFQQNVTSLNRSFGFSALPNRRHVVEVFGQSCSGEGSPTIAVGECIAPISGPSNLSSPSLSKSSSDGITLTIYPADEANGPISCYFLVVQLYDSWLPNKETAPFSQSFLDDLMSNNLQEANSGLPYLAVTVGHLQTKFTVSLGDNQTTTCDVNDMPSIASSTRQRRSASNNGVYQARNFPLVQNQTYIMYVICATPSSEGNILLVSSDMVMVTARQEEPILSFNQILVWIAGPVLAVLALAILAVFLKRRKSSQSSAVLDFHASNHQAEAEVVADSPQKPLEIPFENITMLNKLGEGHFSEVWKVRISYQSFNSVEAAAKIIKGAQLTVHQHTEFEMELELMHLLGQNPFVIQLYGICQDRDRTIAITELVTNGDLHKFLIKNRPAISKDYEPLNSLGTRTMIEFSRDIASGMEFISSMNLVHRDLACRNVLLTEELRCKISDFGLSRQVTETDGTYVKLNLKGAKLPCRWMSPEAYFNQTYTSASDVWSFGIVMWEIVAFGYTPYKKLNGRELQNKVIKENYRLPQPHYCPPQLYNIMHRCWDINPFDRPTFTELRTELEFLATGIENYEPVYENVMKEANLYEDVRIDVVGFAIG